MCIRDSTTPAGMYPNVGVCNLDVAAMPDLEAVVDVVYNPDKTEPVSYTHLVCCPP